MARTGYCDQCNSYVWLADDGSCPQGHTADHISGAYEAYPQPPQPPAPTRRSNHAGAVAALIAVGVVGAFFVLGILVAIAIPTYEAGRAKAMQRTCFENQRAIYGAGKTYEAEHGALPETMDDMVREDYLPSDPTCPAGGGYGWNPHTGTAWCTVHGAAPALSDPGTQVSSLQ